MATAALAKTGLTVGSRLDLLDLRAESFIAHGDSGAAAADAKAMLELARRARKPAAHRAGAQSPRHRGISHGQRAGRDGHRGRSAEGRAPKQTARAGSRQPVSPGRSAISPAATTRRRRRQPRRPPGCSRRWDSRSARVARCGRSLARAATKAASPETERAANQALALARRSAAISTAWATRSTSSRSTSPISPPACACCSNRRPRSKRRAMSNAQGVVTHNLGLAYSNLGLYRRARRLLLSATRHLSPHGRKRERWTRMAAGARGIRNGPSGRRARLYARSRSPCRKVAIARVPEPHAMVGLPGGRATRRRRRASSPRPRNCCATRTRKGWRSPRWPGLRGRIWRRRRRSGAGSHRIARRTCTGAWPGGNGGHGQPDAVVGAQPGARGQRQARGRARGAGHRLPLPGQADRGHERRRPAPQLSQQDRRASRDRRRVAQGRRQSAVRVETARRAPGRQDQPARTLRAARRHRAAPERIAQRRGAARIPDRRGHRAFRRRARAAGAGDAEGTAARRLAGAARRGCAGVAARHHAGIAAKCAARAPSA